MRNWQLYIAASRDCVTALLVTETLHYKILAICRIYSCRAELDAHFESGRFAAVSIFTGPPAQRRNHLCGMPLQGISSILKTSIPVIHVLEQTLGKGALNLCQGGERVQHQGSRHHALAGGGRSELLYKSCLKSDQSETKRCVSAAPVPAAFIAAARRPRLKRVVQCADILPSMAGEAPNAYDSRAYDTKMQEL